MVEAYKAMPGVEKVPGSADLPLQHQNRRHSMRLEDDTFQTKSREYRQAELQDSLPQGFTGMWSLAGSTTPAGINQSYTGIFQGLIE